MSREYNTIAEAKMKQLPGSIEFTTGQHNLYEYAVSHDVHLCDFKFVFKPDGGGVFSVWGGTGLKLLRIHRS